MSQTIPLNQLTDNSLTATHPTFILVDGHSLAFRSYFAFAKSREGGLKTKSGIAIPTSVCFGFLKSLLEVMGSQQPQAMAIAFDLGLPTFRHEADDTYKADRPDTPEDFVPDLKNLHELLEALNLKIFTAPGYEADDVLGTLAEKATAAGYKVKIVTGDRDLFQLVDSKKEISVLYLSPESVKRSSAATIPEFSTEQVQAKLGVLPSQVVDFKALCGDKSDSIPGVRGIGEKTAVKLLNKYGSLDNIYAALDEIEGANQKKLQAGKEDAEKSRYLAKIVVDVPLEVDLEDCKLIGFDTDALIPILEKLEFKSFIGKVNELQQRFGGKVQQVETETSNPIDPIVPDEGDSWFFSAEDTAVAQQQTPSLIKPQIIDTEAKLVELRELLQTFTNPEMPIAWDTETTALDPRDASLVGIGCCWGNEPDEMAYIPLGHKVGDNLNQDLVLDALRQILESSEYPKVLQNAKFDRLIFHHNGIKLNGVVFDPMLASYILNPEVNSHNLTNLSQRYLGLTPKSYSELVPKDKTIADLDIPSVADYCGMDVYTTFQLVPKLREELQKIPALYKLLLEVEQPLEPVLADMEDQGIRIDTAYLQELSQKLETDLAKLEQQVYEIAGEKFNLGSPKQLSNILFEKLGLSTKHSRKIQTGYSTDAATLEKLQEVDTTGIIDAIIEYRTLSKLKSTYVDALPALVHPDTGRIHTDFNQTVTSTGRLSSSNPNLQNIPIRTAFSRQIRKAFLPEPGWLMVAADYSQIELRILAHLSQEPVLVEAYQKNEDIHTVTARLIFEREDVTPEERRLAKTINFGVIYGMGSLRFARSTGVDKANANEFIKRFNQRYPKVFEYLENVKKQAIALGYVETILGRRRYCNFTTNTLRSLKDKKIEDIDLSTLKNLGPQDSGLLRSAANAPIQGSSADIIKIAMIKLHQILQNYQAHLLLQVHDELVFEVPPQEWEELQPQIKSVMENAVTLTVPLVVDVNVGENWMETK
ncbi:DNA polymerase I [Aetokthonos hydrillicola Thurmond2011]|jgi:DNA polymerase-1|uniref:DNA polymerase I n=1 Tax=Aetokthonos hydrillicola Thurmond2011 TaxID=2712845 RepID=A0AAP5I5U1_9CYAN|nr:DNA polymerase I [Aetokthonos hydrillicola]MBW4583738.1 DNA polymerase I [Aetokthonos hydrillicola CCALA 1050]MDR9895567.1 DNA polymerase I [Aetokthonos hydrillicola Thurmond2011]